MKPAWAFAALLAAIQGCALAQTAYKCKDAAGATVYQDQPCASSVPQTVKLHNTARDLDNAQRIEQDQRERAIDEGREQEAKQQRADADKRQRDASDRSHKQHCDRLQRNARDAAEWKNVWHNQGLRDIEERKRKEASDQFFTDCPERALTYK